MVCALLRSGRRTEEDRPGKRFIAREGKQEGRGRRRWLSACSRSLGGRGTVCAARRALAPARLPGTLASRRAQLLPRSRRGSEMNTRTTSRAGRRPLEPVSRARAGKGGDGARGSFWLGRQRHFGSIAPTRARTRRPLSLQPSPPSPNTHHHTYPHPHLTMAFGHHSSSDKKEEEATALPAAQRTSFPARAIASSPTQPLLLASCALAGELAPGSHALPQLDQSGF